MVPRKIFFRIRSASTEDRRKYLGRTDLQFKFNIAEEGNGKELTSKEAN
jgi:hypothetical protein